MATKLPFQLGKASLGQGVSLIVVDPDGVQYEIKTSGDAAQYLAARGVGLSRSSATESSLHTAPRS